MPITESDPTKTFQMAKLRAFGLNFEMTNPDANIPMAENAIPTAPVTRLLWNRK